MVIYLYIYRIVVADPGLFQGGWLASYTLTFTLCSDHLIGIIILSLKTLKSTA